MVKSFDFIRANRTSFLLLLFLFILPFIASSLIVFFAVKYEGITESFSYFHWALFYLLASFTMAFALTHTTFIALIGGYFLGWISIIYMAPAYLAASLIGYFAAKFVDKGKFLSTLSNWKNTDAIMNNLKRKEFIVIFFARLSPILPFAMMNALLSLLNAHLRKYLTAGFLGMLPRTILFIWVGSQASYIKELLENPDQSSFEKIAFVLLLVVSVMGLFIAVKKAIIKSAPQ